MFVTTLYLACISFTALSILSSFLSQCPLPHSSPCLTAGSTSSCTLGSEGGEDSQILPQQRLPSLSTHTVFPSRYVLCVFFIALSTTYHLFLIQCLCSIRLSVARGQKPKLLNHKYFDHFLVQSQEPKGEDLINICEKKRCMNE